MFVSLSCTAFYPLFSLLYPILFLLLFLETLSLSIPIFRDALMLFIWCFDSLLAPYPMNSFFSLFLKLSELLVHEFLDNLSGNLNRIVDNIPTVTKIIEIVSKFFDLA